MESAVASGRSLEDATRSIDLSAWRDSLSRDAVARGFFDAVLADNIARAWAEATGTIDD